MGTGASSESTGYDEVRDRINSADFQKISPPSSPSIMTKQDEMSYSGILVEKPGSETETSEDVGASAAAAVAASSSVPSSEGATFAADLTTPPASNRSKSRIHKSTKGGDSLQPRRIVKATPPPSKTVLEETETKATTVDSPAAVPHHTTLASPIGANATNDLLEESIAKNDSKSKRLEKVSNRQKNDREKLLQEKRRMRGNGAEAASEKPQVEANPFSRFLSAFRVDANSKHKRKESNADKYENDPADTKRVKYGFSGTGAVSTTTEAPKDDSDYKDEAEDTDAAESNPSSFSWIAAASAATVAILIFAMVKGKKRN